MKILELTPRDLDEFPRVLEEGILYISAECELAAHKCCCGCGEDVFTPLNPARWRLSRHNGRVSLHPSIGNWKFRCRSHYWVRNNRVIPSFGMGEEEIAEVIEIDQMHREQYFSLLQPARPPSTSQSSTPEPRRWLLLVFKRLRSWL